VCYLELVMNLLGWIAIENDECAVGQQVLKFLHTTNKNLSLVSSWRTLEHWECYLLPDGYFVLHYVKQQNYQ